MNRRKLVITTPSNSTRNKTVDEDLKLDRTICNLAKIGRDARVYTKTVV